MDAATQAIYDRWAGEWGERRGAAEDGRAERFRGRVGDGLVADLGCGVGRHLGRLGEPVIGLDGSFGMLALAATAGRSLLQGDLEQLPLRSGSVAGVFARRSYLHVPKARIAAALGEAYRILVPGGRIVILLIGGDYEGNDLPGDDFPGRFFACWQSEEFLEAMAGAGFVEVATEEQPLDGDHFDLWVSARRP